MKHPIDTLADALRAVLADPDNAAAREHATRELGAFDEIRARSRARQNPDASRSSMSLRDANFSIGGRLFATRNEAWKCAKGQGFNGTQATFYQRTAAHPEYTWEQLIAPVDPARSAARRAVSNRKQTEMHNTLARMNARRVPKNYPVRPILNPIGIRGACTCDTCHLSWDNDAHPTPPGRCPFEAYHP